MAWLHVEVLCFLATIHVYSRSKLDLMLASGPGRRASSRLLPAYRQRGSLFHQQTSHGPAYRPDTVGQDQLFSNDNFNNASNALLALITVLAAQDFTEAFLIHAGDNISDQTMWALVLMRSHASPSRMRALRNKHVLYGGRYHGPKCRRELALRTDTVFCYLSRFRAEGPSRKIFVIPLLIRAAILLFELAAIIRTLS